MSMLPARHSLFDEFFRDFTPGFFIKPLHGDAPPAQIKMDVRETGEAYQVEAELPGVGKEDIHVEIDGALVTIRAEVKQFDQQGQDERALRSERYYGLVSRSFQLPQEIDREAAAARYENGVLNLTLPKRRNDGGGQRLRIE
ncbi:Hsp20/alpha crystallin family protein [Chromobacterium subtsugae]|uniref:Hsp20/alpha crystallin family protein n=1 Tax=Chromobacterium subtsugae TaxID=251747 RepID=A0ABS7F955_9NEIS|nr:MULTISPECIES: Hsp20/alpha crystallin family protein [Chromobacterium]KUM02633.1 heat-shock protein Hsp20 [Chromobacterium subtsugae]KZE88019.1 heat-shock protein Hsp20 [Chromobacterium sp. F49]MBW7565525.1 Hsp20/alpha crystallin family protein [Chromobacterium subtsugae]MBW8286625.1 Hsp20/alpha crystallin family protein [Chromobacterium subtsugae]WSE90894.1 Hsp20/alpha crystallin family protein [Chromobacterium subtsugae]